MNPVYLVDIMGDIVAATADVVLPIIQANETEIFGSTGIQTINYQKGHKIELIQTLKQMGEAQSFQGKKYPLVYLVQDFTEQRGRAFGKYATVNLNIIIAHFTERNLKTDERYTKVFKPVLYPIYYELVHQIATYTNGKYKPFANADEQDIYHDKTDRLFWGTKAAGGSDGSVLNDYLDAIEISNLNLILNYKIC